MSGNDEFFAPPQSAAEAVLGGRSTGIGDSPQSPGPAASAAADGVQFPPVVYVPCNVSSPDEGELSLDMRTMRDGRTALLVYSALDRLVHCCGRQQPWVVVWTAQLEEFDEAQPFDVVLLDVEIPPEHQRGA
ncbi:SAV_915 family protein [Salinifilum ghardaiensis]